MSKVIQFPKNPIIENNTKFKLIKQTDITAKNYKLEKIELQKDTIYLIKDNITNRHNKEQYILLFKCNKQGDPMRTKRRFICILQSDLELLFNTGYVEIIERG